MTQITAKRFLFALIVVLILIFAFFKCNDKDKLDLENKKHEKTIDSLKSEHNKVMAKYNASEKELSILHNNLLSAQNRTQISETKLYNLQRKTVKPQYIKNVKDCNDTIQKVYELSVLKDSACNVVISDKNVEIAKQDTIIKFQEVQKSDLLKANDLMENANKNLEFINDNKTKQIRKEKLKKNFWKATAVGVGIYAIKLLIFKK